MNIQGMERFGVAYAPQSRSVETTLTDAVKAWRTFCKLPIGEKKKISLENGVGYENKQIHRVSCDRREDLHFNNASYSTLSLKALELDDKLSFRRLISSSSTLIFQLQDVVLGYAGEAEKLYGLTGLVEEVEKSRGQWMLRFHHYFPDRQIGEEVAPSHSDRCGFSLHLYQSERGLEFLPYDNEGNPGKDWVEVPVVPRITTIIPSLQLQLKTQGRVKALCHRVVAEDGTVSDGRYSVVCSVPFAKSPKFGVDKVERQPEFFPGFNYAMPFDEFKRLFV